MNDQTQAHHANWGDVDPFRKQASAGEAAPERRETASAVRQRTKGRRRAARRRAVAWSLCLSLAAGAWLGGAAPAVAVDDAGTYEPGEPDEVIPEHGKYTRAYMSDWTTLPTGDEIARQDPGEFELEQVAGEAARQVWRDEDRVHLSDLHLEVTWEREEPDKGETTLLQFENVAEVVIENVTIVQNDPDYRAWDTIRVEGAENVIVRNVHLAGPVHSYHLRLEGCKDLLVENIEITGVDFDGDGYHRVGGGLWINNGASGRGGIDDTGLYTEHARVPGWQVVQNSYFHNGTEDDGGGRNHDAILIHAASDGVLFNNVVENWLRPSMDAAFDLSFRRFEPAYQDRFLRVERNVLKNSTFVKGVGGAPGPNAIFYANNLFINVQLADYHGGGNEFHYVHNTYIYDLQKAPPRLRELSQRGAEGYAALWRYAGATFLTNSLLFKPDGRFRMFYLNAEGEPDKYRHFFTDHNVYALGGTDMEWLRTAEEGLKYRTLNDWRQVTGADANSEYVTGSRDVFADYEAVDYRLVGNPWPDVTDRRYLDSADPRLRVDRDFDGLRRSEHDGLAPGAFRHIADDE